MEDWRSFGARSRNSEREESIGGGEARPVERRRRALLASAHCAPRKEKGGTGRDRKLRGVREDKSADDEVGRDCRRVEAAPTSTVAGMAGERHSGNAVATVNSFETNLTPV